VPVPAPGPGQVLVKISAASLNHRDLFIRQHLYPGISFTAPLFSDAYGIVTALGPDCSPAARDSLLHKPVILVPTRGWDSSPDGPEQPNFCIIGAALGAPATGAAIEYLVVDEKDVVPAPEHLTPAEGACLPVVGVTAWRSLVVKSGNALPGRNILITGIGGGVALQALQFAVAKGCNVWVTSGEKGKIERAVKEFGAKGGVSYREKGWEKELGKLLPKERPFLDAVIDGAGGDVVVKTAKLLKPGGVIVSYGMTLGPKIEYTMQAVLKNIDVRGATMGSAKEFREMLEFVRQHRIRPVISRVAKGLDDLEGIERLFEDMKAGRQFGKLVVLIDKEADSPKL
jgi:NADPH:quinone reductase-like Zn-dependent oxidoreductase